MLEKNIIRLNEDNLRKIIEMVIFGSFGVPSGITETSDKILTKIVEHLVTKINDKAEHEEFFTIKGDFNISNFEFNSMQNNNRSSKKY